MHELHYKVEDFVKLGIRGYVLKSDAVRDLIRALDALIGGGTFLEGKEARRNTPESSKFESGMFRTALGWA
jgi:DNA-binding NarL/FixJ family response regulator